MDPTSVCCPKLHCHARGHSGQGNIGLHSQQDQRVICTEGHKTCRDTTGTVCSRWRPSAETVGSVGTVLAPGCPVHALVAAFGCDERTVATWWARAGRQGQAVHESLGEPPRDLGHIHAEEMRVKTQGAMVWMAMARMGKTRLWLGGAVREPRDMPLSRRFIGRVRRGAAHRPLVCCPDGLRAYLRAMRETFRAPVRQGQGGRPRRRSWPHVLIAQVVQRSERRRVVETERRSVDGSPARGATRRRRSQGEGVIHTAYSERLHATFRARFAPLARRCRALAPPLTLHHAMYVVGTASNFCTPPAPLDGTQTLPPAMAAGVTDHGWTMRAFLSLHVPPPRWTPPKQRGRPSQALQRLIERWCV